MNARYGSSSRFSLAVVAGDILWELGLTPPQLGSLSGILFYVYGFAQLPLGPLIDRLGGRIVISACGVLTALGGILFAQAESLPAAMAARILIGTVGRGKSSPGAYHAAFAFPVAGLAVAIILYSFANDY